MSRAACDSVFLFSQRLILSRSLPILVSWSISLICYRSAHSMEGASVAPSHPTWVLLDWDLEVRLSLVQDTPFRDFHSMHWLACCCNIFAFNYF